MNTISDEKLRDTRAWLVARSVALRERIEHVQADLRRDKAALPNDVPDAAIILESDEILEAVESSARGELDLIERALERMEAGSFATCEECGAAIVAKRLSVVPYISRCARCAQDA